MRDSQFDGEAGIETTGFRQGGLRPGLHAATLAAQVLNAFLMPLVIGFLAALAVKALPEPYRLRGWVSD